MGLFFIDMSHKKFHLLVKLYYGQQFNDNDLELFNSAVKEIKDSIKKVSRAASEDYLPSLKSNLNYRQQDEKVIKDFIKQTIINTIYKETGIVFNYFFYGRESFKKNLDAKIQEIVNPSIFRSNVFIQSVKQGIISKRELTKLRKQTSILQKTNRDLLTKITAANKFLGKKVSAERLDFYSKVEEEYQLLRNSNVKGHRSSLKAAVRKVLHRTNKQVSETTVTREYKALWGWLSNQKK